MYNFEIAEPNKDGDYVNESPGRSIWQKVKSRQCILVAIVIVVVLIVAASVGVTLGTDLFLGSSSGQQTQNEVTEKNVPSHSTPSQTAVIFTTESTNPATRTPQPHKRSTTDPIIRTRSTTEQHYFSSTESTNASPVGKTTTMSPASATKTTRTTKRTTTATHHTSSTQRARATTAQQIYSMKSIPTTQETTTHHTASQAEVITTTLTVKTTTKQHQVDTTVRMQTPEIATTQSTSQLEAATQTLATSAQPTGPREEATTTSVAQTTTTQPKRSTQITTSEATAAQSTGPTEAATTTSAAKTTTTNPAITAQIMTSKATTTQPTGPTEAATTTSAAKTTTTNPAITAQIMTSKATTAQQTSPTEAAKTTSAAKTTTTNPAITAQIMTSKATTAQQTSPTEAATTTSAAKTTTTNPAITAQIMTSKATTTQQTSPAEAVTTTSAPQMTTINPKSSLQVTLEATTTQPESPTEAATSASAPQMTTIQLTSPSQTTTQVTTTDEKTTPSGLCGGYLQAGDSPTNFTSPGYPTEYSSNTKCVWFLAAPVGRVILITVSDMDIEGDFACRYDYLEFQDPQTVNQSFCGTQPPPPYITSNNTVRVIFSSDSSVTEKGFHLTFRAIAPRTSAAAVITSATTPAQPSVTSAEYRTVTSPLGHTTFTVSSDDLTLKASSETTLTGTMVTTNTKAVCGSYLNATSNPANLTSPNYPDVYPANSSCIWTIVAPESKSIRLTFNDIDFTDDTACENGYLEISEINKDSQPRVVRECSTEFLPHFQSQENVVQIRFESKPEETTRGFHLTYSSVDRCGGNLQIGEGVTNITSPGYPGYREYIRCEWRLTTTAGRVILVTINDIDIEPYTDDDNTYCPYDYLEFQDPYTLNQTFCGSETPAPYLTTSNTVSLIFLSDLYGNYNGFHLSCRAIECGSYLNATSTPANLTSPNYPDVYPINAHCVWTITAPENHSVRLTFYDFTMEESEHCSWDFFEIRDIDQIASPRKLTVCRRNSIPHYQSQGRTIQITFHSDSGITYTGFRLTYSSVDRCGGNLQANESPTNLTSPGYPMGYRENTKCVWLLAAPVGREILITVNDMEIVRAQNCKYDYLEFLDSQNTSMKYCGSDRPPPYVSTESTMRLIFFSDSIVTRRGFHLSFRAMPLLTSPVLEDTTSTPVHISSVGTSTGTSVHPASVVTPGDSTSTVTSVHKTSVVTPGDTTSTVTSVHKTSVVTPGDTTSTVTSVHPTSVVTPVDTTSTATSVHPFSVVTPGDATSTVTSVHPTSVVTPGDATSTATSVHPTSVVTPRDITSEASSAQTTSVKTSGYTSSVSVTEDVTSNIACGSTLNATSIPANLTSPNYPEVYPVNSSCIWTIVAPQNKSIKLIFNDIEFKDDFLCENDYLEISEINKDSRPRSIKDCNLYFLPHFQSQENVVQLRFQSNSEETRRGFHLTYVSVDRCGGYVQAVESWTNITSPGYPGYREYVKCVWLLEAPVGMVLLITINDIDIQSSDSYHCPYDYLEFQSTQTINQTFCGSEPPPPYLTTINTATVIFSSDDSTNHNGFHLSFRAIECGSYLNATSTPANLTSPNYPDVYPINAHCVWTITAPENHSVRLTFYDFTVEQSEHCSWDYLEIREINQNASPRGLRVCYRNSVPHYQSQEGRIQLIFHSDNGITHRGFRLTYSSVDRCGGNVQVTESPTNITSPYYPMGYREYMKCVWLLEAAEGSVILITVNDIDIEFDEDCQYDYLEYQDPENGNRTYCGSDRPSPYISTGRTMKLIFFADSVSNKKGFHLSFRAIEIPVETTSAMASVDLTSTATAAPGIKSTPTSAWEKRTSTTAPTDTTSTESTMGELTSSVKTTSNALLSSTVPITSNWMHTIVFVHRDRNVRSTDEVFMRGGIDHSRKPSCDTSPNDCTIPIQYLDVCMASSTQLNKYNRWSQNDTHLDWNGKEASQGVYEDEERGQLEADGSPMMYTVKYENNRFYQKYNVYVGYDEWIWNVLMDCDRTFDGWFEFETRVGGEGEPDLIQAAVCNGTAGGSSPTPSNHHLARCGQINYFVYGQNSCRIDHFNSETSPEC